MAIREERQTAPVSHVVAELGLRTVADGPAIHGSAAVVPELCAPGTSLLRTSVLAIWADILTGYVAGQALNPRIPVTLDLEVQLHRSARIGDQVSAEATALKVGRTVVVCETRFRNETSGELVALAHVSFVASPDPAHVFPGGFPSLARLDGRLTVPLAERIGLRTVAAGTVEMPRRPGALNAVGAIQGGLVAVSAEEAAMSLVERPGVLSAFSLRYLRGVATGPARAVAKEHGGFSVVHVTDAGSGKLCILATTRLTDPR
jgi:acyl-coenzyme A thioesterase PaaI-like protein